MVTQITRFQHMILVRNSPFKRGQLQFRNWFLKVARVLWRRGLKGRLTTMHQKHIPDKWVAAKAFRLNYFRKETLKPYYGSLIQVLEDRS